MSVRTRVPETPEQRDLRINTHVPAPEYAIKHEWPARRFRRNMEGSPKNLGNGELRRRFPKETREERKARKRARRDALRRG